MVPAYTETRKIQFRSLRKPVLNIKIYVQFRGIPRKLGKYVVVTGKFEMPVTTDGPVTSYQTHKILYKLTLASVIKKACWS